MESSTTRMTMRATASHDTRRSRATVVLSMRLAHQATMSSTSRVCRAPARAHGTSSVRTRWHLRQCKRRISASSHSRLAPRSR